MTMPLILVLLIAVMVACGVYLLMERSLTRMLLGFVLVGNGVNVLILAMGGPAGHAPFAGEADAGEMTDPLPQALILTAIVISFGITAFLLAMIYRSWKLAREDAVTDDEEDVRIAQRVREERAEGVRTTSEATTDASDYVGSEFGDDADAAVEPTRSRTRVHRGDDGT